MMLTLDHIAICAADLSAGVDWTEAQLGVPLLLGGRHDRFGTHNRLLGLADGIYLEVIAPDPDAQIDGPRWFGLDHFEGSPRPGNWICRTDDLEAARAAVPVDVGRPVALTRDDLRWRMAVPEDGSRPMDGGCPTLIEWGAGSVLPGDVLPSSGCTLLDWTVLHPEADRLRDMLAPHLDDPRVIFETGSPGFRARIETPGGQVALA